MSQIQRYMKDNILTDIQQVGYIAQRKYSWTKLFLLSHFMNLIEN